MNIILNAVTSLKKYSGFFWILSDFGLKFCVSDYLAQWILLLLLAILGVNLFTAKISKYNVPLCWHSATRKVKKSLKHIQEMS